MQQVVYFTVNVDSKPRVFLSVKHRDNGDLLLSLRSDTRYREAGSSISGQKIKEQRYSVHQSRNSANEANGIKQTLRFADGSEINTSIYTKAIKAHAGLVHVFSRRFPQLSGEHFDLRALKAGEEHSCIGEYDPRHSSLILSVLISSADFFLAIPPSTLNSSVHSFGVFKLYLVWRYAMIPAGSGAYIHSRTVEHSSGRVIGSPTIRSMRSLQHAVKRMHEGLMNELFSTISADDPVTSAKAQQFFDFFGYSLKTRFTTEEVSERFRELVRQGRAAEIYSLFNL